MRIERTTNYELIRSILQPVWKWITDDGAADCEPNQHPAIWYVVAHEDKCLGLYTFIPQNLACYEVHIVATKAGLGKTRDMTAQVFEWMWQNSPAKRIVAAIPTDNRLVLRLARAVGMCEYGTNPRSFQRGGKLHDQILFGISK